MQKHNVLELPVPEVDAGTTNARSVLEEVVRQGAIQLLQQAIDNEVAEYLERHGHLPQREILSGIGPLPVRQPRVRHSRNGGASMHQRSWARWSAVRDLLMAKRLRSNRSS